MLAANHPKENNHDDANECGDSVVGEPSMIPNPEVDAATGPADWRSSAQDGAAVHTLFGVVYVYSLHGPC